MCQLDSKRKPGHSAVEKKKTLAHVFRNKCLKQKDWKIGKKFPTDGHHTSPGKMMDGEDSGKPFVPLHVNNWMQNLFWKPRISHFYFAQLNPPCFHVLSIFCCGLAAAYLSLLMDVTCERAGYEMRHLGGRIRGTAQPKVTALLLSDIFSLAGQQQHRHHRNFTRSFPGNVLSALLIRIHKHTHAHIQSCSSALATALWNMTRTCPLGRHIWQRVQYKPAECTEINTEGMWDFLCAFSSWQLNFDSTSIFNFHLFCNAYLLKYEEISFLFIYDSSPTEGLHTFQEAGINKHLGAKRALGFAQRSIVDGRQLW